MKALFAPVTVNPKNEIKHLICKFMRNILIPQKADPWKNFFHCDDTVIVIASTVNKVFMLKLHL